MRWMVGCYALLCSLPVWAQTDTLGARILAPIVVVANKAPYSLLETGKSVWKSDADALLTSAHLDWAQRLLEAGVVVGGAYSNLSKNKEFFYQGASSRYMLTLIDGTPVIDPSLVGEAAYDLRMFSPSEPHRLELLKGGYGALYGANIVAGALNFITDEAAPSVPFSAKGSLSGGSFGTWQPQLSASGQLNSQAKWKWGYKLTSSYVQSRGISEAQVMNNAPLLDKDGFARLTYSISLPVVVGDHWRIRPYLRHSRLSADTDAGSFVEDHSHYRSRFWMSGIDVNWSGATSRAPKFVFKYAYERFYSNYTSTYNFEYPGRFQYAETYAFGRIGAHIRWLGGWDYRRKYQKDLNVSPHSLRTSHSLNPYATLDWDRIAGTPLHVQVGTRLNWHDAYGAHFTYHLNPYVVLKDSWRLHAMYATSFRPPDLYSLSQNADLRPEQATNIALGLSVVPTESKGAMRLAGELSFFARDIWNMITYAPPPTHSFNARRQRDYGMEITPMLYGRHWQVRALYAYTNGHLIRDKDDKQVRMYNLIRRPRHAYQLSGQFQWMQERLQVRVQLQGYGKRIDHYFTPSYTVEEVSLKAYALLHAYVAYALLDGRLRLFIEGRNLTNNTDYTDVYGYTPLGFNGLGGIQFAL